MAVPSVLASSVCCSLQCLISTLTQGGRWWTLFLGSLIQSRCGEGGRLQINNTGMCSQCLSHTGPALPVAHRAQALGCSTGNCLRPALGCMHLPGLSRSGSGTWVVLRGAHSVGPAHCALPGSGQLGCLASAPVSAAWFSGCTAGAPSQAFDDCPEPQDVLVSKEACLQFGK